MNAAAGPRAGGLELGLIAAIVYVVAVALLVVPAFFLAFGVQAAGATFGWWDGDPNSNDGEEVFATVIGVVGSLALLTIAGLLVARAARRSGRSAAPPVAIGTSALVIGLVASCFWVIAA